jgi:hypothetical protein
MNPVCSGEISSSKTFSTYWPKPLHIFYNQCWAWSEASNSKMRQISSFFFWNKSTATWYMQNSCWIAYTNALSNNGPRRCQKVISWSWILSRTGKSKRACNVQISIFKLLSFSFQSIHTSTCTQATEDKNSNQYKQYSPWKLHIQQTLSSNIQIGNIYKWNHILTA